MKVVVTTSVLVRCDECGVSGVRKGLSDQKCGRPFCNGNMELIRGQVDSYLKDRLA